MLRISICLLAGAFAPQLSSFPPRSDLIAVLMVALVGFLPWLRRRDLVWLIAGVALFCIHVNYTVAARLPSAFAGESMLVLFHVADFPQVNDKTTTFTAEARTDIRVPSRVRLSWFAPPVSVRIGDVWKIQVRLRRPRGSSNPGSMDAEAWLTRERVGATGYVVDSALNELVDSGTAAGFDRLREKIAARIAARIGERDSAAVLAAIVVGARHQVTAAQWERYARTGTSHLMAISGLHIGLAAIGAYYLARLFLGLGGAACNHKRIALAVSFIFALLYAAISGFAVPAQRAVLMLLFATASLSIRREVNASRILTSAAVVITVFDPLATMAPGFRLSFAAVVLLFWFAARKQAQVAVFWLKPVFAIKSLASIQIVFALGLLPLVVSIFDRVSLSAPLVNLLAVPVFSVITVPLALCSVILAGPLETLGNAFLYAAAMSIHWIDAMITFASALPFSAHAVPAVSSLGWVFLLMPLTWVLLPPGWPGRCAAWLGVAALLMWKPAGPPPGCTDIVVLDVGQGLAVVVLTDEAVLLYDTGPAFRGGGSAARHIVLPYLRSLGVNRIDRIVVSHADLDHAGGLEDILAALPADQVFSGDALPGHNAQYCNDAVAWRWGTTRFSVLHPRSQTRHDGNDASCVVLIETGDRKALLTGDIESAAEAQLVRRRVLPHVDIVTVPHHGSQTSSIPAFVRSLAPDYAVVSAAWGNQWGFPKPVVVARWRAAGASVLNTATSGAIRFRQCAGAASDDVRLFRRQSRRIWHDDWQYAEF